MIVTYTNSSHTSLFTIAQPAHRRHDVQKAAPIGSSATQACQHNYPLASTTSISFATAFLTVSMPGLSSSRNMARSNK